MQLDPTGACHHASIVLFSLFMIVFSVFFFLTPRLFYGPQGPYSLFAGRDATRALALMSFDPIDLTGDLDGLGPDELEVLQDWEDKFKERYPTVGHLASENAADGNHGGAA
jgi:membrane-associated progesterone receptor component